MTESHITRRQFLQALGAGGIFCLGINPVSIIASLLTQKQSLSGVAWAGVNTDKRFIFLQTPGAPARWMFDLFLNPDNSTDVINNAHMATQFKGLGSTYDDTVPYFDSLVNVNGTYVPPLWMAQIPACDSNGQATTTGTLSTLLPNLIHFRGANTNNSDHNFSSRLHMMPPSATMSISALTAGVNGVPLPAVNMTTSQFVFASNEPISAINIPNGGNLITTLLRPFAVPTDGSQNFRDSLVDPATRLNIRSATLALGEDVKAGMPEIAIAESARSSAFELISRPFPDFTATWTALTAKYNKLVSDAITARIPGVSDKPIGTTGFRGASYKHATIDVTHPDLRSMINLSSSPPTNFGNLASRFALLEFILLNDLSRSISLSVDQLFDITTGPSRSAVSWMIDEHGSGSMVSLYLNTMYFCGVGACLLELVRTLKVNNLWDKCVIDFSGEFNRLPRNDRSGSDHNFRGASSIVLSGAINQGPFVIGNIYNNDANPINVGTHGRGAPNPTIGNAPLSVAHVAASLATILEVPSPVTAATSLVERNTNGTFQPSQQVVGQAKIIRLS